MSQDSPKVIIMFNIVKVFGFTVIESTAKIKTSNKNILGGPEGNGEVSFYIIHLQKLWRMYKFSAAILLWVTVF